MLRLIVIAVVVAAAQCAVISRWGEYKAFHGKQYEAEEEDMRRAIFFNNLAYIEQHNNGKHPYSLGTNEYADWTNAEFVSFMNGFRGNSSHTIRQRRPRMHRAPVKDDLPMTVDWRQEGYVTEVKNQKQCGSCWAFSTTGSLEGQHFKVTGNLVSLSEQNLMDCSTPEGNMGCNGGLMDQAFEYIKINDGVDTEESYPYTAMDGECMFNPENVGATDTGYVDVERMDEMALKDAVANVGPISVAIDASKRTFQLYESGVYMDTECSSTKLDHGVLAVGYGTNMGQDYWLVKNSWGMTWGMKGYIMMARNMNNMCGIATQASYPTVNAMAACRLH